MAIVGAGASGILCAAHLLRTATGAALALRVVLIDSHEELGGVAYATGDTSHRLNVTAAGMSAFPDAPDHFVRWRERLVGASEPAVYAPRGEYRRYLADLLSEARRGAAPASSLVRLVAEVEALDIAHDGARLRSALTAGSS